MFNKTSIEPNTLYQDTYAHAKFKGEVGAVKPV